MFISVDWIASEAHRDAQFDLLTYWHQQFNKSRQGHTSEDPVERAYRRVSLDFVYHSRLEHVYTTSVSSRQKVAHEGERYTPIAYVHELVAVLIQAAKKSRRLGYLVVSLQLGLH